MKTMAVIHFFVFDSHNFITPITIITIITVKNGHPISVIEGSILYIFKYKYIKIEFHVQPFGAAE